MSSSVLKENDEMLHHDAKRQKQEEQQIQPQRKEEHDDFSSDKTTHSKVYGYLGIDNGTQGLSVIFTDESLHILAKGEGCYDMVPNLSEGCYEQRTIDWDIALQQAMKQIRQQIPNLQILAIGISGQMHGQVLYHDYNDNNNENNDVDEDDKNNKDCSSPSPAAAAAAAEDNDTINRISSLGPVRLWCDARNEQEGIELTELFQTKVPKRSTVARWLWTIRNQPNRAKQVTHMTTPAGWISYRLTGQWTLGIGDASGMFPIDATTFNYNIKHLTSFQQLVQQHEPKKKDGTFSFPSLESILPKVVCAGQDAGMLSEVGAHLLGLDSHLLPAKDGSNRSGGTPIPVAAAEGDQPAALAGSLIGRAGMVSCSFGTSVCANSVGTHAFSGVSPAVDHFCAPDGKPINMVWLRNGTTYMNTIVSGLSCSGTGLSSSTSSSPSAFDTIMPLLVQAKPDCGGLLATPFMDDEPGLGVSQGGTAMIMGWNSENAKNPGNAAKAALLATMFNLKRGSDVLDQQDFPRTEIILSGGLTKTPECGQILADVFGTQVTLLESADEGSCWGAAVLAKYRNLTYNSSSGRTAAEGSSSSSSSSSSYSDDWPTFLESVEPKGRRKFTPNPDAQAVYQDMYERYTKLLALQPQLNEVMAK